MRGDDERRMEKLKEFASKEDDMVSDMRSLGLMDSSNKGNMKNDKKGNKRFASQ